MASYKPCSHPGCGEAVPRGHRCCSEHGGAKPHGWEPDRVSRRNTIKDSNTNRYRRKRKAAMDRDHWLCQECKRQGRMTPAIECDHIDPLGGDSQSNLQALCIPCHRKKSGREAVAARDARKL